MTQSNVAQDQIKAYVDRILRMKEEADAIAADVKEIYVEAKANGFDKTQLGNLVTYLRKKDKDAEKVAEGEAIFDLYLEAYMGASGKVGMKPATHAHAPEARRPDPLETLRADPALAIVAAADLLIKSEPQPPQPAGSDLAVPLASLGGQVAPQSQAKASADGGTTVRDIETPDDSVTGDASRVSGGTGPAADIQESHRDETPVGQGAPLPCDDDGEADKPVGAEAPAAPAPLYAAPGVVTWENSPPEGVVQSEYSRAFGAMGQDIAVIEDDLSRAAAEPIQKIGNVILDGWARYMKARSMTGLDGKNIDYPVVQYAGDDPLIDCIRWNMNGRILDDGMKRTIAQRLVRIEPKRKADIYRALELFLEPV